MANKIERTRGDTASDRMALGQPISGFGFLLTISTEENPTDTANQVIQMVGVIVDGLAGDVDFYPTLAESNALVPGDYFWDFQFVVARPGGGDPIIKTLRKGDYIITQDITKGT